MGHTDRCLGKRLLSVAVAMGYSSRSLSPILSIYHTHAQRQYDRRMSVIFRGSTKLGEKGTIVIPASVRHQFGLEPGAPMTITVEDDGSITMASKVSLVSRLGGSVPHDRTTDNGPSSALEALLAARRGHHE